MATSAGSLEVALSFIERIERRCKRIGNVPNGGVPRPDLGNSIRVVPVRTLRCHSLPSARRSRRNRRRLLRRTRLRDHHGPQIMKRAIPAAAGQGRARVRRSAG
ncbi:hypothetical protein [Jiella avicenniae]|uniref:hypothetical protein n=1 Tax=Jiella avicenniae TaxID=2907202 RepID=UPI003083FD71